MLAMWAVRALGWLRSAWGIVADYPWQAICIALSLVAMWEWHGRGIDAARDAKRLAQWQTAFASEQVAFRGEQRNYQGSLAPLLVNYASIDPRFGYAGAACGILLVIWNQDGGKANG
jgi:hypothetical protein